MSFNLNIVGLKELQTKLQGLPKEISKEVSAIVESGAKEWVRGAKRDCKAVDNGFLRAGISYAPVSKTGYEVVSSANYSAYVEWGTITKVDVPAELSAYAIQFKGKGIRKNGGMIPRPFFFKQRQQVKRLLEQRLKTYSEDVFK